MNVPCSQTPLSRPFLGLGDFPLHPNDASRRLISISRLDYCGFRSRRFPPSLVHPLFLSFSAPYPIWPSWRPARRRVDRPARRGAIAPGAIALNWCSSQFAVNDQLSIFPKPHLREVRGICLFGVVLPPFRASFTKGAMLCKTLYYEESPT